MFFSFIFSVNQSVMFNVGLSSVLNKKFSLVSDTEIRQ